MTESKIDYEALIEKLHGDGPIVATEPPLRGAAAAAAGHELMLAEYGSEEAINRAIRAGRPCVGDAKRGPSPTVRGRIPDADYAALARLRQLSGKCESELVREAIHLLLQANKLAN
jgi:hypothetical protein